MESILVIGGNAAGITAASRAKRLNPRLEVTILEKTAHISYSTCGIPFFLSGGPSRDALVSFTPGRLRQERGITAHTQVEATAVFPARKRVHGRRLDTGEEVVFSFDRLLLATGVEPRRLDAPGAGLRNVFSISNLADAIRIRPLLESAENTAVVGGGYVGLEMAETLRRLGKRVTLFEKNDHVLAAIDPDMARIVEYELRRHGVALRTGSPVEALVGGERVEAVKTRSALGGHPVDAVFVDTGVTPRVELAREAGIRLGETGGIAVSERMETSQPGVFAAGNCAETFCLLRRRAVLGHVGTVAAKQGRVAGENLAGRRSRFSGSAGTTILKVFDLAVGRTGFSSAEARAERVNVVSARIEALDRAPYDPGARKLWIKLLAERESRRLVGAQVIGYGEAARRVDVAATVIRAGLPVDELAQLDLAYTPPYGSLWDPLLVAAHALLRQL